MISTRASVRAITSRAHHTQTCLTLVGFCCCSAEDKSVPAQGKALISTGLAIAVPEGTYGRVAPRSGLGASLAG